MGRRRTRVQFLKASNLETSACKGPIQENDKFYDPKSMGKSCVVRLFDLQLHQPTILKTESKFNILSRIDQKHYYDF